MDANRRGQVITFYSYKGGVGRTMALANVAAIQAQRGKRVLALDFDFEAPGLHRYFITSEHDRYTPAGPQQGMLNFFSALHAHLRAMWPAGRGFQEPEVQRKLPDMLSELFDARVYLYHVNIANPNTPKAPPVTIDFVPAARFDGTYPELVRRFDWQGFYNDYAELFPVLAGELAKRYDYVFIDSRTGVTDLGSICTMMLPDKLVLTFTPNEQSLVGALDAGWQAVQGRKELTGLRSLPIFPLVSRIDGGEHILQQDWIGRARRGFERLFREAYGREVVDLESYFDAVRIPYKGFYSYGERIAAEDEKQTVAESLSQAFNRFAECLEFAEVEEAQASFFAMADLEKQSAHEEFVRFRQLITLFKSGSREERKQAEQNIGLVAPGLDYHMLSAIEPKHLDPYERGCVAMALSFHPSAERAGLLAVLDSLNWVQGESTIIAYRILRSVRRLLSRGMNPPDWEPYAKALDLFSASTSDDCRKVAKEILVRIAHDAEATSKNIRAESAASERQRKSD